MATIQSQLKVNDGMSATLRRISSTLDTLTGSFIHMQSASANSMDTQNFEAAIASLNGMFQEVGSITAGINDATVAQVGFNQAAAAGADAIDIAETTVRIVWGWRNSRPHTPARLRRISFGWRITACCR